MFNFNEARNARERMDMLTAFIKFWMGDEWQDDFGVPEKTLSRYKLPYPLKRLYSFAGNLPPAGEEHDYTDFAFSIQDHLCSHDRLRYLDDGRVEFLWENQGNWSCATLSEGEDPPVWVENNDDMYEELEPGTWVQCSDSLSKFLITYCLQELMFGANFTLSNPVVENLFATEKHLFHNIWKDGVYVYKKNDYNYYLMHNVILVSDWSDGFFATNSPEGIRLIKQYEDSIFKMAIDLRFPQYQWSIEINDDGSGKISISSHDKATARFPKATFNFRETRDLLLKISLKHEKPSEWEDAFFFHRVGQPTARGIMVPRRPETERVAQNALASITVKDGNFDALRRAFPIS